MRNSSDLLARLTAALSDRYRIERELGSGGMAVVFLAEDLKHRRKVALKVLKPELSATLGPERFVREIEIAARLAHPHILPLFDSGEADGFLYYVMPFVVGESLRERLERAGKLSVDEAIRLTDDIAAALTHAHDQGIVHRDIKPENIMLTGGRAVVADFGIARAVEAAGGERLTGTGLAIGTPAYMSPEQALGSGEVDARSDIYALGCVVYEMVGGRPPFEGPTPQALLAQHAADTIPGLRSREPTVPLFVARAVEKALAKDPSHRFPSARVFAEVLRSGTVVPSVDARRRLRYAAAAALATVLVAAAGWWIATSTADRSVTRLAVLPLSSLMNDPEQEYFVQGMHDALISELAQAGVGVIARTSMMQYRDTDKPVREIAQELNVHAVIEASLARTGDSVRLRVQLIDGRTEGPRWAQTYEGDLRDAQLFPRRLTREVARVIGLALTPDVEANLAAERPVNPQAYEAYLKGRFHWQRLTPQGATTALEYFQLALAHDPGFALAHTGIAVVWGVRGHLGWARPSEASRRWKEATNAALALNPRLPQAHAHAAAQLFYVDWNWGAAEPAFRRALDFNPNDPDLRVWYGEFLSATGRSEEGLAEVRRALATDPHNVTIKAWVGEHLARARRYEEAVAHFEQLLRTDPSAPLARGNLQMVLERMGRYDAALAQARQIVRTDVEVANALERGYERDGYRGAMRAWAEVLVRRAQDGYVAPTRVAGLYAAAGESDLAIDWLEKGFQQRQSQMVYVASSPRWETLRDHPRYQELLRRMNLGPS